MKLKRITFVVFDYDLPKAYFGVTNSDPFSRDELDVELNSSILMGVIT